MGQPVVIIVCILIGVGIGAFVGRLLARDAARSEFQTKLGEAERRVAMAEAALPELRAQIKDKDRDGDALRKRLEDEIALRTAAETGLDNERERLEEQRALLDKAQEKLKEAFQAVAAQALNSNNESFL